MKKLLLICFMLVIAFIMVGCNQEKKYSDDAIIIEIKSDCKNEFINKEFKIDDFDFDNIETFSYSKWYDTKNRGYLFIYLKKTGKKEVEEALKHFKQLSFVEECEKMPIIQMIEE